MSALNDEIIRATGGPTVNDGLALWFSKTATESLQDAESRFLLAQVGVTVLASNQDMWMELLGPGEINDLKLAYWTSQP